MRRAAHYKSSKYNNPFTTKSGITYHELESRPHYYGSIKTNLVDRKVGLDLGKVMHTNMG